METYKLRRVLTCKFWIKSERTLKKRSEKTLKNRAEMLALERENNLVTEDAGKAS